MEIKKIIVTGGAGMIGSNLVAKLLNENYDITIIDNFWRGSLDNLKYTCGENFFKIKVVEADLSIPGDWEKFFYEADCIYHLADIVAGIGYVFSNEGEIFRKNLLINANVTQIVSKAINIKRYIYVGTACSFPKHLQTGLNAHPLEETDQFPALPESAYGWSKLMGELDAGYLASERDIKTVVLSLHNVFGSPCDYKSSRSQVIPSIAYRALTSEDNKLEVWGNGQQGRAFIHVKDIVDGLYASLESGHNIGVIQLGPNVCTSIKEIALSIISQVSNEIKIEFDLSKPTGDLGRCANFDKAKKFLKWEPKISLNDGLADVIEYIKQKEGNK
jgi:nucleoside-diphosphate-sugar epimerase